ncbi:eukaryotic translation initiation factor 3 subunit H [Verticillium alfalfae VaMs.102]|uniref:Eukaryotic translation initiation factor 3 subunit H n=2 Tax=Verticillium TaxID=1036719 RepID=C9S874_VERA1|nr:eukaryotic translation initiation factor 3 subunit H [Verticillium alfalfae VaMs.102]EEY15324.1 eukaryotic translation initiation factor 3 subunit H [Verticillium alfalfae VaMs.102]
MAEAQAPQDAPFNSVVIEALVVMKIVKHGSSTFPTVATGATVGLDRNGVLEITNSFPFPTVDVSNSDSHQNNDASAQASAAPRQKSNIVYQSDMIKHLKEVNVDANNVGWYTSATMSNFVNLSFIENQYHYQKDNDKTVALVHDVSRSSQGSLSLRAFKLSASFMAAYKEGKFTTESLQKSKLSFKDILQEFPVTVHNTHLLTTFLHQIPQAPQADALEHPTSVGELRDDPSRQPLYPSVDNLDLSIDPFLEKTCDLLLESIDAHYNEVTQLPVLPAPTRTRAGQDLRSGSRKRKARTRQRVVAKQAPLPEGRVAAAVQAAPGAQPPRGHAQREAGRAVQQAGRWVHGQYYNQDVRRAGEPDPQACLRDVRCLERSVRGGVPE